MEGCQSQCKDTNFKANHNKRLQTLQRQTDVSLNAKIRILKQITTEKGYYGVDGRMLVSMQRYEF